MSLYSDHLLLLTQLVLKALFLNLAIHKVFFDGKKDIEALHFILGVGIHNVYDVQAVHMALFQFKEFAKNKKLYEVK